VQLLDVHKEGIIHLIVPPVDFELLSGREDLATYEFNTKVEAKTPTRWRYSPCHAGGVRCANALLR
jgi:hypothetical protein